MIQKRKRGIRGGAKRGRERDEERKLCAVPVLPPQAGQSGRVFTCRAPIDLRQLCDVKDVFKNFEVSAAFQESVCSARTVRHAHQETMTQSRPAVKRTAPEDDDAAIILSDDSGRSDWTNDLFDSDEGSRDVVDVNEIVSQTLTRENSSLLFGEDEDSRSRESNVGDSGAAREERDDQKSYLLAQEAQVNVSNGCLRENSQAASSRAQVKFESDARSPLDSSMSKAQNEQSSGEVSSEAQAKSSNGSVRESLQATSSRVESKFEVDARSRIAAGKLLDVQPYILLPTQKRPPISMVFNKEPKKTENNADPPILDARDPKFLENYYARSRLHLISTLAQEMKDYVITLRESKPSSFYGRDELKHLSSLELTTRVIFHVDLDCFFVSVALRDRPDLIGKPVAITHSKGVSAGFSELASVSYSARQCGLQNGMLVRDALELCPNLICLPYSFDDYRVISKTIYTIVARYTLEIRAVSCDEMYVDCTELFAELRISNPVAFAEHLRAEIKRNTGCPASVGIGENTLIARLATRYAKPDGVHLVSPDKTKTFIANEKVRNLPGLGYHTFEKLASSFESELVRLLGKKIGSQLFKLCRGLDDGKSFIASSSRKCVSCDINYGIRFTKKSEVAHFLRVIAEELERKLKQARSVTSSVTLKLMIGVQCGRLALISDVGYSVKSEAITRMFGTKAKKKEEPEETKTASTSEVELPTAEVDPPFNEQNKSKIMSELVTYLHSGWLELKRRNLKKLELLSCRRINFVF
ncbi:unnamed protein product [Nippostrongylus brasiliensis]|uniref:DNA repair protein REV1 (inferred by orthology to a human protein) n=1 Tax=Nippostrongylus brasiliensis TaxID=27835 RepID=A0A158R2I3_NIPBR|nr:unnamed protein product [Nippostrongylus brasiliensis]